MKKWILRTGIALWLACSAYTLGVSFLPGPKGLQGIQGNTGATGLWGLRGPQGLQGERGYSIDLPKLYKQMSPAVVWIGVKGICLDERKWQGTGFFVTPCLIATAGHIVRDTEIFEVMFSDGTRAIADFVCMEDRNRCDVGFIRLRKEYRKERPYFKFNTKIEIGEDLIIIGYPWGLNKGPTLTKGVVSLLNRDEPFFGTKLVMHTDTAAWPGNSGSPVIDMNGKCVGIYVGLKVGYDCFSMCTPAKLVELAMQKALAEIGLRDAE